MGRESWVVVRVNEKPRNRFVILQRRIEKIKVTSILIAWLSLCACLITYGAYPQLLSCVAGLCLIGFSIMFGWYLGLKDAYNCQMKLIRGDKKE